MEDTSIWTEKYRPKRFEELVGQDEIIKRVKNLTNSMNIPHLLFAGPAGTGKSTLALVIMGHPNYTIDEGEILFNGKDIKDLEANERAKLGLFLSFQYPYEVSGVTMSNFLRTAINSKNRTVFNTFSQRLFVFCCSNFFVSQTPCSV